MYIENACETEANNIFNNFLRIPIWNQNSVHTKQVEL